jgi:hypothetical protein
LGYEAFIVGDEPTIAEFTPQAGFEFARFGGLAIDVECRL